MSAHFATIAEADRAMQPASHSDQRRDRADTRAAFQRTRARNAELAARHRPIGRFAPGLRVEITNPAPHHRPLAGRTGAVILLNESGSAWVRVELPEGRTTDHCVQPGECSREVRNG